MGKVKGELVTESLGEEPRVVAPLRVVATLKSGIVFTHRPMLDGILAAVYARRARLQTVPHDPSEVIPISVPLAMSECGQFALCSEAQFRVEDYERRYKQRRPLITEFARLAPKVTTVKITGGLNKAYRIPYRVAFTEGDTLTWYALGDAAMVRSLLAEVFFLGKHTGSGKGEVESWDVAECEAWEGFPALRDGEPLRALPESHPGVRVARHEYRVLAPPYWMRQNEVVCAVGE